jgi:hypothetical protein
MISTTKKTAGQQKKSTKIKPANLVHPLQGTTYFDVRKEVFRLSKLKPIQKMIYLDLISTAGKKDFAHPRRIVIAENLDISMRTLDYNIQALKKAGLIYVIQRGLKKSNLYYFTRQAWHKIDDSPTPKKTKRATMESTINSSPLESTIPPTPIGNVNSKYNTYCKERQVKKMPQQDISKKMLDLWISIVEGGNVGIELGDKLIRWLKQALKDRFGGCLERWKGFCLTVASSKYLMGEKEIPGIWGKKWRASLEWCLRFSNIDKILSGKLYGIGDRIIKQTIVEEKQITQETVADIENLAETETVKEVRKGLAKTIGGNRYNSWIKPCIFEEKDGKTLVIKPKSNFASDYIQQHFGDSILMISSGLFSSIMVGKHKITQWERGKNGALGGNIGNRDMLGAIEKLMELTALNNCLQKPG